MRQEEARAELAKREMARRNLMAFCEYVSPWYHGARHQRLVAEYLEQVEIFIRTKGKTGVGRLLIFMPPRHGKCLGKGSLVYLSDGRLVPIENVKISDRVISLSHEGEAKVTNVVGLAKNGEKPVYKIILQSGKYLLCTDNHPLMTIFGWQEVKDLKVGNCIAGFRQLPMPDNPINLSYGYASIMGYLIGDGSFGQGDPEITISDDEIVEHLNGICRSNGWVLKKDRGRKYSYSIRKYLLHKTKRDGSSAKELLRKYIDPCTAWDKRVPRHIFISSRKDICDFLAAYFNCDGSVTDYREGVAEYYSVSEYLLRDVQHLLTRLGIYSSLRIKKGIYKGKIHLSWRLTISGVDVCTMANTIPVIGEKGRKLRALAEKIIDKQHYPEYEAIPTGWKKFLKNSTSWYRKYFNIRIDKQYKHGTARQIVSQVADIENNDELRKLCNTNIIWERIVSIELVGNLETYDLQVSDYQNFSVGNLIVHNSQLASRLFPAWLLGRLPDSRIILASYGADLAVKNSRAIRTYVQDDRYKAIFGDMGVYGTDLAEKFGVSGPVELSDDSRSAQAWNLAKPHRGGVDAAGVGGAITGLGADLFVADDLFKNRDEAESQANRERVWDWWTSSAYTRLEQGGAVVGMMTRWHPDDWAGKLLKNMAVTEKADRWVVINLPALAEDDCEEDEKEWLTEGLWRDKTDALGRSPGEALWKEKYNEDDLDRVRSNLGEYDWNALYQQRPYSRQGGMFKRDWLPVVDALPERVVSRVRYWDKAASAGKGDYTVGVLLAKAADGMIFVENVVRGQWSTYERDKVMERTAQSDLQRVGAQVVFWQEMEPGSSGIDSAQSTAKHVLSSGIAIHSQRVTGSKETRANPWSSACEAGMVRLLRAPWNSAFVDEHAAFPNGLHDDQVDASAGAYAQIVRGSQRKAMSYQG